MSPLPPAPGPRQLDVGPAPLAVVSDHDILHGYRFFLGRDPESEAARSDRRGATRLEMVGQMMGSAEFAERVTAPALAGRPPSGGIFSAPPPPDTLAWAADVLPLDADSARTVAAAATWPAAFAALAADSAFRTARPDLDASIPLPVLASAMADVAAAFGDRTLAGAVDETTATTVRGWLLDLASPGEALEVELLIDGRLAATTLAAAYAPEVLERFGGTGRHGFLFEGVAPPFADADDAPDTPLPIALRERTTQVVFATGELPRPPREQAPLLARLALEVAQARRTLEAVEGALADLNAAFGFTPLTWDVYARAFYVRTPAQALREAEEAAAFGWRPRIAVAVAGGPYERMGEASTRASLAAQSYAPHLILPAKEREATPPGEADYVVTLDAGDRLTPDALHRIAAAVQGADRPALVVVDSDTLDPDGTRRDPVLRPGFDPELALQQRSLGQTAAVRIDALHAALGAGGSLAPEARHDLWLRILAAEGEGAVRHLPRVLHHTRPDGPALAPERLRADVEAHLARTASEARALKVEGRPQDVRIAWPVPPGTRAAVIIPTRDRLDLLEPCVASLEAARADNVTAMEIVVVDNASAEPRTREVLEAWAREGRIRLIHAPGAFNWSALNNLAAREVEAEVLVFLNNDTAVRTPDWLDVLCGQALRAEVGAVGARLLYDDGAIQHAGVILGVRGTPAAHEGAGAAADDGGYLGRRALVHRAAAVTGACMAVRGDLFLQLGGFDSEALPVEAGDIDFCLRVRHAGLAVVYEPHATLLHYESRSRGHTGMDAERRRAADVQLAALERRWGDELRRDPFYNPHFDRAARPFARLGPPPEL